MDQPLILAFDTSAAYCAAALLRGAMIVAKRVDPMAKGQAEHLMPMLEALLRDNGATWGDLQAIGVGTGPGNFTGIRIAVAAARGLSLGLGIPAVGVNGFDARAHGLPRPLTIRVAAPRGQHYLQHLTDAGGSAPEIVESDETVPHHAPESLIQAVAQITAARWQHAPPRPAPLYVRSADAAPPRDPAPLILP